MCDPYISQQNEKSVQNFRTFTIHFNMYRMGRADKGDAICPTPTENGGGLIIYSNAPASVTRGLIL